MIDPRLAPLTALTAAPGATGKADKRESGQAGHGLPRVSSHLRGMGLHLGWQPVHSVYLRRSHCVKKGFGCIIPRSPRSTRRASGPKPPRAPPDAIARGSPCTGANRGPLLSRGWHLPLRTWITIRLESMSESARAQASEILKPAAYMAVRIARCLREMTERSSATDLFAAQDRRQALLALRRKYPRDRQRKPQRHLVEKLDRGAVQSGNA